ncbi:type II toxin-antitoxin system RelE/ParE family toxin [soil metagenome]
MNYSVLISDEATFDIIDAFNWYQAVEEKLSIRFEKEVESTLDQIKNNPNQFQLKYKTVRVVFLKKFPFGIHYVKDKKTIKVIAVFHTGRDPKSWGERLKQI